MKKHASVKAKATATATRRRRGYRGLSAEELSQERYQRLIDTGMQLFGERGYAATPIEAVCSQANVSTRHFYEEFGGRESILHAVYEALVEDMAHIVESSLADSNKGLGPRVADTIEAVVYHLLEQPSRGRILCIEAVGVSKIMERKRRETIHRMAGVLSHHASRMADNGTLPRRDYRLPGIALVGMINELIAEWLTENTGLSAREMAREAKILFRAMLFGVQHYQPTEGGNESPTAQPASPAG